MSITRDNYEEFFLLYADNELSAADRSMVEQWVAANPDLREEWESLSSYRLRPDNSIIFPDKKALLRSTADINENNYADYFLSYIDGELDTKDGLMVEAFVLTHPGKEIEMEHLRHTVSTPDTTIVFPDKSLLYQKEKDRRVILFYRWAAGAAAVLLAVVSLLFLRSRPAGEPRLAQTRSAVPARLNKKDPPSVTPASTATLYSTEDSKLGTTVQKEHKVEKKQTAPAIIDNQAGLAVEKARLEKQEDRNTDLAIVKPASDPVVATTMTPTANPGNPVNPPVAVATVNIPREQSSFATEALLREDNEKAIAAATDPASPGKSKFRGLFRKVTRTFGKTADRDGDGKREVLIGAFQVSVN